MGRTFLDHMGGIRIVMCSRCETPFTNKEHLESGNYQGSSGKAYLYTKAINLTFSPIQERLMMTGKHYVRDTFCKGCNVKLGWMYEFAVPEPQRHKEGKFILEKAFIKEYK